MALREMSISATLQWVRNGYYRARGGCVLLKSLTGCYVAYI